MASGRGGDALKVTLCAPRTVERPRSGGLTHSAESWFPQPEAIVELAMATAEAGEPRGLVAVLGGMGAPVLDLVVTPLSARAAVLGAQCGRAFYHHELRARVEMPAGLEPEISVWGAGTVPEWRAGILEEPKYFSFFQDAPLVAYNPNHRGKWRAHEILHGAQGFFWHPRMTRFEFYLGARVNELLPVVHWYGLDEILRPHVPELIGREPDATFSAACEALAVPYWAHDAAWRASMLDAALIGARRAREHYLSEWRAVVDELERGERQSAARGRLDASSDAVGYLRGHWNRVTAWSFGAWVETFLVDGVDYHERLDGYIEHCARVAHELLGGELSVTQARFEHQRARRVLQDLGYRVFLALEHLEEGSEDAALGERMLMPLVEAAGRLCSDLLDDGSLVAEVPVRVGELFDALDSLRSVFPGELVGAVRALGYGWRDVERATDRPRAFWALAARKQLCDGLASACPETWTALEGTGSELALRFAADATAFDAPSPLATRFAAWLETQAEVPDALREQAAFEAWAGAAPRQDDEAELFATVPDTVQELGRRTGRLRAQKTLRRARFGDDLVAALTGEPAQSRELAGVLVEGELRLMLLDEAASHVLDALAERTIDGTDVPGWLDNGTGEALMRLIEHGFVVWLPRP